MMFSLLRRLSIEFKKSAKTSLDSLVFRWHVIKRGGYAAKSLIVTNQRYIHIGKKLKIKQGYRIECYPTFSYQVLKPQLVIGDNVIVNYGFTAFVANKISIGSNCILAANVTLISENHGMDPESTQPYHAQPLTTGPITIGEGCWLGQNVSVLPNVTIGRKCIISTSSVVTRDIPDFCIAAGVPARIIKKFNFNTHRWEKFTE